MNGRDPKPIMFNLNEDLDVQGASIKETKKLSHQSSGYQNPFRKVDPFSQQLSDVSHTNIPGHTVIESSAFNMMEKLDESVSFERK